MVRTGEVWPGPVLLGKGRGGYNGDEGSEDDTVWNGSKDLPRIGDGHVSREFDDSQNGSGIWVGRVPGKLQSGLQRESGIYYCDEEYS